jgi:hypothetical protein
MDLLSLLWIAILAQFQRYYCTINETNYCAHCQTSGTALAARAVAAAEKMLAQNAGRIIKTKKWDA